MKIYGVYESFIHERHIFYFRGSKVFQQIKNAYSFEG